MWGVGSKCCNKLKEGATIPSIKPSYDFKIHKVPIVKLKTQIGRLTSFFYIKVTDEKCLRFVPFH